MKVESLKVNQKDFLTEAAKLAGWDRSNMTKGLCVKCSRPALDHCTTEAARREVLISGLCGECWDEVMQEV